MDEEQSVLSAHNSADSAAAKSYNAVAIKVQQNVDGSAASKMELMMDSDAVLTLVGQIIHLDHEYSEILLTKQQVSDSDWLGPNYTTGLHITGPGGLDHPSQMQYPGKAVPDSIHG